MSTTLKNKVLCGLMVLFLFSLSVFAWIKPMDNYSDSERRVLAKFPELSLETISSGSFMKDFETYTLDQFPLRDSFRTLKAISVLGPFMQMDVNDLYLTDGYISKLEYPYHEGWVQNSADKFQFLYDKYLKDNCENIYLSIIPDKNYFLAEQSGHVSLDYEQFVETFLEKVDYMEYIDIFPLLSKEDYYYTDTHWRQENLVDVAETLASAMGTSITDNFRPVTLNSPFYGVFYGQSALPLKPDTLVYMESDILDQCIVTSYTTGAPVVKPLYDMDKATGKDPYEMFLCGTDALIILENPSAATEKELIVFRDSFGASLVPLLAEGYSKITLVDIRYLASAAVGNMVEFNGQDVLFLYSTLLLNNSGGFK